MIKLIKFKNIKFNNCNNNSSSIKHRSFIAFREALREKVKILALQIQLILNNLKVLIIIIILFCLKRLNNLLKLNFINIIYI